MLAKAYKLECVSDIKIVNINRNSIDELYPDYTIEAETDKFIITDDDDDGYDDLDDALANGVEWHKIQGNCNCLA